MQAGLLNTVIEIWECSIINNDFGHIKQTYNYKYRTRANVKYNSGNRQFENDEVVFTNNTTFIVRNYVPLEFTSRIKYKNNFYRILSIENDGVLNNIRIITEIINE